MKNILPDRHGLAEWIVAAKELMPRSADGNISITNVQAAALSAGAARGESLLVVAPTSTGKTLIGIWSLLSWIGGASERPRRAVYLVTHRALARQKFDDFIQLLSSQFFGGDRRAIVVATGDIIRDGEGGIPESPLQAPLLIATYEKYLGLLAGQGMAANLSDCLIVCDEIQIVGDQNRGRNVELLLTIIRRIGCGQFVGLSAVIGDGDANDLAAWLKVRLLLQKEREKHLVYECRTEKQVHSYHTGSSGPIKSGPRSAGSGIGTGSILLELSKTKANEPVAVFCMTRARVYERARELAVEFGFKPKPTDESQPLLPGLGRAIAYGCFPVVLSGAARRAAQSKDLFSSTKLVVLKKGLSASRLRRFGRDDGNFSYAIALRVWGSERKRL